MVFAKTQQLKENRKHLVPAIYGSHTLRPRWDRPPPILPFLFYGGVCSFVRRCVVNKLLFINAFRNAGQLVCSKPLCLRVSRFVFCTFLSPGVIAIAKTKKHNPAQAAMRGPTGTQKTTPALLCERIALLMVNRQRVVSCT